MPNLPISRLVSGTQANDGDKFVYVQQGITKQIDFGDSATSVRLLDRPLSASTAVFTDDVKIEGSLYVTTLESSSIIYSSGSTIFGDTPDDTHRFTGSVLIKGDTVLDGNIVPLFPSSSTLGTLESPFAEIFLQSGSINIESDTPGDPSAVISNVSGNLEISVGGMLLVEQDASFIAPTGSFSYLSGSFNHIGSADRLGDTIVTGSFQVSGSTITFGDNTLEGNTELSGSINVSGSFETDLEENLVFLGDSSGRSTPTTLDTLADSGSFVQSSYMSLFSTSSQPLITSGSEQVITFTSQWASKDVTLVDNSKITFPIAGVYQMTFIAQLSNPVLASHEATFWIKYNGNNFPNSATKVTLPSAKNANTLASQLATVCILVIALNDNDYIELYWTGDNTNLILLEESAASPAPETPSIRASIIRVG